MSDDIRTLLTNRPRAKVERRDTTLKPNLNDTSVQEKDVSNESDKSLLFSDSEQQEMVSTSKTEEQPLTEKQKLEKELESFPTMGKRLAIHLERDVRNELLKLCDEQEITPETFMEATFVLVKQKPNLVKQIMKEAKQRLSQRKRAGLLRRTLSLMDKLKE
ncbi:MAG: hypothetical protein MK111_24530 [Crocosphaera sp.]|uniref:Uncharacterized protein n=3 Tax=Crocosphaera watsonii TaxID=263511 RepID=T2JU66_CROWT|nr:MULTISPECIES: hypothetical protein [Crocosphaera]EHJ09375.1 hypothetical protein CWATWH0003_B195 [Crocosphaera watsonii WH 0003]MCH2247754.1 hypothetical protein [Crocosphaera sp.]NQZ63693.1 hypothetical protein [Crocosphaera sp.]CCQ58656.1 hypothetical protein CWATWH0005_5723 [Crocosphaera watsonii WH 0005]CCQ68750.1 hypothetical protein CWATWH0402_1032 [Crocosphaera watsonii WH 0402]